MTTECTKFELDGHPPRNSVYSTPFSIRPIKPPFPFPSSWNQLSRCAQRDVSPWLIPTYHSTQTLAISFANQQTLPAPTIETNYHDHGELDVEDQEYMVDFALEMNDEWAAKLVNTAKRLQIVSDPRKPSKAKIAHKRKTRAKSKLKRQTESTHQQQCEVENISVPK